MAADTDGSNNCLGHLRAPPTTPGESLGHGTHALHNGDDPVAPGATHSCNTITVCGCLASASACPNGDGVGPMCSLVVGNYSRVCSVEHAHTAHCRNSRAHEQFCVCANRRERYRRHGDATRRLIYMPTVWRREYDVECDPAPRAIVGTTQLCGNAECVVSCCWRARISF